MHVFSLSSSMVDLTAVFDQKYSNTNVFRVN